MTPITALTDPNQLPNQLQDQQTFDANMASMVDMFPERARQENGLAAEMMDMVSQIGAIAAGGAYAIPYVFDTSTVDGDPGPSKLRLSHIPHNASTFIRLDLTSGGQDYTTLIDTFDDSTSAVKGSIRLVKQGDITKWMTFNLTAMASPSGYRNLSVVCTDSSAASPFSNGDPLMLFFQRNGDKGQDAVGSLQLLGSATVGAAVAQIDFLNIFSAAYDKYVIELQNITPAAAAALRMRLAVAGAVDTSSSYNLLASMGGASAAGSAIDLYQETGTFSTMTVEVRNANSSGFTSVGAQGSYNRTVAPIGPTAIVAEGGYRGTAAVSGFRLYFSSGNIATGVVRVFGVKNS